MNSLRLGRRSALLLPLVLLTVVIVEELIAYEARQRLPNPYLRTALMLFLYGVGFALAATKLAPWLGRLLARLRRSTRRGGGAAGVGIFYILAYGSLYVVYFIAETRGIAALLPPAWR